MLNVTSSTIQDLKQVLHEQKIDSTNLRIISSIGWGGMSFNLVLDEPGETDKAEEHEGLNFLVENEIYKDYGPFKLVSIKQGSQIFLQITAAKQANQGGGCNSCSSCG